MCSCYPSSSFCESTSFYAISLLQLYLDISFNIWSLHTIICKSLTSRFADSPYQESAVIIFKEFPRFLNSTRNLRITSTRNFSQSENYYEPLPQNSALFRPIVRHLQGDVNGIFWISDRFRFRKLYDSRPHNHEVALTTFFGVLSVAIFNKRKRTRYAATRCDILCHFSRQLWKSIFWHWSFTKDPRSTTTTKPRFCWVTQQEPLNLERYLIFLSETVFKFRLRTSISLSVPELTILISISLYHFQGCPNTTVPLWQHVGSAIQTEPREFGCIRWGQFG